jgi:putative phosphoribosyl transferase
VSQIHALRLVDRRAAGDLLADHLQEYSGTDAVVVGITRGGLIVAHEIARRLNLPVEALVVHRMSEPGNSHLGIGAVTEHGQVMVNRRRLRALALPFGWLRETAGQAVAQAHQRATALRGERERRDIAGRPILLVDDSAATGTTLRAAVRAMRSMGVRDLIVAVPVAPPSVLQMLRRRVDGIVCPTTPADLILHGMHYPAPLDLDAAALGALLVRDTV